MPNRTIIVILGVVVGIIVLIAMRPQNRLNVSPLGVEVQQGRTAGVAASLSHKGWFQFSFSYIGGTVSVTPRTAPFTVAPVTQTVTAAAPDAQITITGVSVGAGTFDVSGISIEGSHGSKTVDVTVFP